jgi:ATP adenylyltransferase
MSDEKKINLKDIWPQERDFIFRPDRLKYVRRLKHDDECVFCKSGQGEPNFENLLLYKTGHSQIVLNKYPYNNGHLIVCPLKHGGSIFDLSDEEYEDLMKLVRFASKLVKSVYPAQGLNIGINHEKAAGAGIPDHLHWHVIPRWFGDTNFFPVIAETKVLPETLEQSYEKLSEGLKALQK